VASTLTIDTADTTGTTGTTVRTGADTIARILARAGVDVVFTLCGNHVLPLYAALHDAGVRLVDTRTESGAVMAADAYARVTRTVGVALVTGGPGLTNALTGLVTAHAAGSSVLLISGQLDLATTGQGGHQELDQAATAAPCAAWSKQATHARQLPALLTAAFAACATGGGAAHLSVPTDVLRAPVPEEPGAGQPAAPAEPAGVAVAEVLDLLAGARRPAVIAGSGAHWAHCEHSLTRLVEITGIPLFTVDLARGLVPDAHPRCYGYADPSLSAVAARMCATADVVLLLGKSLDFRLRFGAAFAPGVRLVGVTAAASANTGSRPFDHTVTADLDRFTDRLAGAATTRSWSTQDWTAELDAAAAGQRASWDALVRADDRHPLAVADALAPVLGAAPTTLVLDAGDFVQWCRSSLPASGPGRWIRLGPMATCGAGTPFALGARHARPGDRVLLVTGDGSFGYYLAEFEAAARQGLPFVAVVGDNNGWALERNLQQGLYGEEYVLASRLSAVRYDRVVEGLGGYGEYVEHVADLGAAVERAFASGRPACVQIPVGDNPSPLTAAVIARKGNV
jgi:acetolactate synthase-1/2/3 large subunit